MSCSQEKHDRSFQERRAARLLPLRRSAGARPRRPDRPRPVVHGSAADGRRPVPERSRPFEVESQGHAVRGHVWGDGAPDRLPVHGWGGRGSQLGAMVEPLLEAGFRVVMFDAPAHGDSDHGPAGPGQTNGVEFAKALDAVFCRFGPAEAVVAHSIGTISTYLAHALRVARRRAPGVRRADGRGRVAVRPVPAGARLRSRVRAAFDREVDEFVGVPVAEFDARVQARHVDPVPTLVITDRGDRQTPYADAVDFAESIDAPLVTTEGLGHRKILRDPAVVERVVDFVSARDRAGPDRLALREMQQPAGVAPVEGPHRGTFPVRLRVG